MAKQNGKIVPNANDHKNDVKFNHQTSKTGESGTCMHMQTNW